MKVIFLDFDGVLNNAGSHNYHKRRLRDYIAAHSCSRDEAEAALGTFLEAFDPVCASNFQYILEEHPDAKIVYSTSWRNMYSMEWLAKQLQRYGIDASRVIGKTPSIMRGFNSGDRTDEIAQYLDEHPEITNYIIIDDAFIDGVYKYRHVHTDWDGGGITQRHIRDAIAYLNNPHAPREDKEVEDGSKEDQQDP